MRQPVFISLTTIADRLNTLDQVLERLIYQNLPADRIILNLSLEPYMLDFGIKFEQLPPQTRKWVVAGKVEIYYVRNTGPYRKIVPTLERFGKEDCLIANADDDVLYPPEWLEVLVDTAQTYQCVAAYRCRLMEGSGEKLKPYAAWPLLVFPSTLKQREIDDLHPLMRLFPTGRDGVIYHSKHFRDVQALHALQSLAPGQDDITLKFVMMLAGVPAIMAPRERTSAPLTEFRSSLAGGELLWPANSSGKNDVALASVVEWCRLHRGFNLQSLF